MSPKVVLIGLDGADWRFLRPWLSQGELPNLAELVSRGVSGTLRSTVRPESSVAWTSLSTGVNPGKHGVFGFAKVIPGSYAHRIVDASTVGVRRVWDYIGDAGMKAGVINMPMTYPPQRVSGFLLSGMLTPSRDADFCYPPELRASILTRYPDYIVDVGEHVTDRETLLQKCLDYTDQQASLARWLMSSRHWDFFAAVFTASDRLQHFLWSEAVSDVAHPTKHGSSQLGRPILDLYKAYDAAIGEILSLAPSDALVLLVSDHGFNGVGRRFYGNVWLADHNYLYWGAGGGGPSAVLARWLRHRRIPRWLRKLKHAFLPEYLTPTYLAARAEQSAVDWQKTRAYFSADGGLRLNLAGREPNGIVEPGAEADLLLAELSERLSLIEDPLTSHHVVDHIYQREELYVGDFASESPDLIVEPSRESPSPLHNVVLDGSLAPRSSWMGAAEPLSANHTMNGILIAAGASICRGTARLHANLVDIAPTILAFLGVPIPSFYDGRVLSEIFLPEAMPKRETDIAAGASIGTPQPPSSEVSRADEELVESRLRRLGYLD